MAHSFLTLADVAKINDMNLADVDGITDILNDAPILAALATTTASNGDHHKYVKETGVPVVGFRAVDTGKDHSKSADTVVDLALKYLDASWRADTAVAKAYSKGQDAFLDREASRHLRAAFAKIEQQILYGTLADGDAAGFQGLHNVLTSDMVTHAAASGTALTSAWMIRTGEEDAEFILGNDGNIEIEDPVKQEVTQADDATKVYTAWTQEIAGWTGFKLGSKWSAHRIGNIATGATGTKLSDDLVFEALAKFPSNRPPTFIAAHRFAIRDLRNSRTATNSTGAPAPWPTEIAGIPLIASDNIKTSEVTLV